MPFTHLSLRQQEFNTPPTVAIDHNLLKETHFKVGYPAVSQYSLSDRYAVLCATSKLPPTSSITICDNCFGLKQFDPEKFCDKLQASSETKFVNVLAKEEIEVYSELSIFTSTIREIISRHAPRKKFSRSLTQRNSKSW